MKKTAAIALAVIFITFTGLEISIRVRERITPSWAVMPDATYLAYRGRPHSMELNGFSLNSRGFKDKEFIMAQTPGTFRAIAIGDSQTYGAVPYPDTYIALLGNLIRRHIPGFEIYNLGVPSAAPVDYLSILINDGLRLDPDMVLITLFLGDDFNRGDARRNILSYSAAFSLLREIFYRHFEPGGRIFASGIYHDQAVIRDRDAYINFLVDTQLDIFHRRNRGFIKSFAGTCAIIKKMQTICDAKGIALTVVACPADIQLYPTCRHEVIRRKGTSEEEYDFRTLNRLTEEELSRMGIPFLDLLGFFEEQRRLDGKSFNQMNDPHWNLHGSRTAARIVAPWLTERTRQFMKKRKP